MNGVLGLHIIADTGQSNDPAIAFARQLGGRYAMLVNADWKLYQPLLDSGIEVIGRIKNDDWNDDDADNHQTGKAWARHLHDVYPDTRVYLTAGNELGVETPVRTQNWMVEFVEEAARLGHRTAGYHSHFLSPPRGYWKTQTRATDALRAHQGMVCVHKGFTVTPFDLRGQKAIDEDFSRILEILEYGVPVVVTEYTGSKKPDEGWQYLYRDANDGLRVDWALVETAFGLAWLAKYGVYATFFTFYPWNNGRGFEIFNNAEFKTGLIAINKEYPVMSNPTIPPPSGGGIRGVVTAFPVGVPFRNLRVQPFASAADVGDLNVNDEVVAYANPQAPEWRYIERASDNAKGWALWTNVTFIPALLPPTGVVLTPEQALRLRGHAKAADDAAAGIMAVLDEAEGTPGTGVPF